jgi:DNA mismatch repair protein MutS2
MEELLADLERKEREAADLVAELAREKAEAEGLIQGLEVRQKDLEAKERSARARAQEEARRMLLEARREVEEAINEVRASSTEILDDQSALEEAQRRARRRVEQAAQRHRSKEPAFSGQAFRGNLQAGDRVALSNSGSKGVVVEVREDRAVVEMAGVRLQLPLGDLRQLQPLPDDDRPRVSPGAAMASSWQGPEAQPVSEVDLRGLRVSEVGIEVDRALDQAILGGLGELCIIHGKGTGALRKTVSEILDQDVRVSGFRLGGPAEGGAGVTIVRLR